MDLKSLIAKMDAIESGISEDRAEYDRYKAEDARAAAIAKVKKLASTPINNIPRLGDAIDPKTGIIYYGDAGGEAGNVQPKMMPYDWMLREPTTETGALRELLKSAGLDVVKVPQKGLFGTYYVAGVAPEKLANIDNLAADASAQAAANEELLRKLKLLTELVKKYLELKQKKAAAAQTTNESISISKQLVESFGYEVSEEQTDEGAASAALNTVGKGAGKMLSRAAPGLGFGLGMWDAADRWKQGDYTGSVIAGLSGAFSLVPGLGWIPAVGLAALNVGRDLAKNKSQPADAEAEINQSGRPSDPKLQQLQKIIGAQPDGIYGPETKAKLQAWQEKQGITVDGIPGPETYGKAGIKESKTMTKSVAESIRELQQRLAKIEEADVQAGMAQLGQGAEDAAKKLADLKAQAQPASSGETDLAKKIQQAGGQLVKKDDREFIILPDGKTVVDISTMEIVDASNSQLASTGKKFDPSEFGLNENQVDEGLWDSIVKGAINIGKNFASGLRGGGLVQPMVKGGRGGLIGGKVAPGARTALKTGKAIKANPGKTAIGTAALAGGAGYMAGGPGGTGGTGGVANTRPNVSGSTRPTPGSELRNPLPSQEDDEMNKLLDQINALVAELSQSKDAAIQKGLQDLKPQLELITKK